MTPKTHTLPQYDTEINYDLLPWNFSLNGYCVRMTPEFREKKTPQTLNPFTQWMWTYKSPGHLTNATSDVMKALQRHIIFPQEIDGAQNNLVRHSMGYSLFEQNIKLKPFIDTELLNNLII